MEYEYIEWELIKPQLKLESDSTLTRLVPGGLDHLGFGILLPSTDIGIKVMSAVLYNLLLSPR